MALCEWGSVKDIVAVRETDGEADRVVDEVGMFEAEDVPYK